MSQPQAASPADEARRAAQDASRAAQDATRAASEKTRAAAAATLKAAHAMKPKLRGWIHSVTAPLALAAGIVLIALTPAGYRWASAVFAASSVLLFTLSAVYHRGNWSLPVHTVLRRLDHSNIFLLIAGTYTPLSVIYLPDDISGIVLAIVWGGAAAGIGMKFLWLNAPRWLYVPIYIALGWVAVAFLPDFWHGGGAATIWLIASGGIAYTLGAAAYGFKWPNPSARWFGFHEIFHTGTVIGWVCHYIAVMIAVHTI